MNNDKLSKTLDLFCSLLLLILGVEWLYISTENIPEKPTHTAKTDKFSTLSPNVEHHAPELLARPLFTRGRKPVVEQPAEPVSNDDFSWQLNGVYTAHKGWMALVSRKEKTTDALAQNASTAKLVAYQRLSVGSELDSWTVTDIRADSIELLRNEQKKILALRKNKSHEQQTTVNHLPFNSGRSRRMRPKP